MTDTPALDQRSAALIDELLWLARHAQQRIELENLGDYWYVLGQRNTYARAAALIAAPHLGEDSAVIGERIVDALTSSAATSDLVDLDQLRSAALGTTDPAASRASSRLEWMGRKAFDARYGDIPASTATSECAGDTPATSASPCAATPTSPETRWGCSTRTTRPGTSTPSSSAASPSPPSARYSSKR